MIPLVQSVDGCTTAREGLGYGLSQATFVNDQSQDQARIFEDLYIKVKNGDVKGVRYILGINDDDSIGQIQPINIHLKDQKKNTLLMHAVWREQTQIFHDLIRYSLSQFDSEKTLEWITAENDAGNQCMHIASQKGNLAVLETIFKLKIKLSLKQKYGQTCLHIAVQSDYPALVYFLIKIAKIDIDITDNEMSTPLHIVSFYGNEQSASLLLAWGASVNLRNKFGMTPLHLTALSGEQRITRKLLLYKAKPWLKNQQGKTAYQVSQECDHQVICRMIAENLEGNVKCSNIFGLKNKPRINEKIRLHLYGFSFLIFFNLIYQILFTIGNNIYGYLQIISDLLLLIFYIWVTHSNPGYQKQYKESSLTFFKMLQNNEKKLELCAECETLKAPRTRHCDFCNRCVIVFDHHCPWINNCIGAKNHFLFIIFIQITLFTVGLQLFISINLFIESIWNGKSLGILTSENKTQDTFAFIFDPLNDMRKRFDISIGVQIEFIVTQVIVTFIFTVLLSGLLISQMITTFTNKTTFERMNSQSNRKRKNQQQSDLLESNYSQDDKANKYYLKNCLNLMCRNKNNPEYNFLYQEEQSQTPIIIQ